MQISQNSLKLAQRLYDAGCDFSFEGEEIVICEQTAEGKRKFLEIVGMQIDRRIPEENICAMLNGDMQVVKGMVIEAIR